MGFQNGTHFENEKTCIFVPKIFWDIPGKTGCSEKKIGVIPGKKGCFKIMHFIEIVKKIRWLLHDLSRILCKIS